MKKNQSTVLELHTQTETESPLDQILREGALTMLRQAIEAEVAAYIEQHSQAVDSKGHRLVVRNGYAKERKIQTAIGELAVRQARVNDRREGQKFTSNILPPYVRKSKKLEALVPTLYLKGVSTGSMQAALSALLGQDAVGFSAATVVGLKEVWQKEYQHWQQRSFEGKEYAYLWVDGIYFNVRLTNERPCILVVIGVNAEGRKELLAVSDGERESRLSWKEVLLDLKKRGLNKPPRLVVGDGALGFWTALNELWPEVVHQRCWVHKTANVLDKLPKKDQEQARAHLKRMHHAGTKAEAMAEYTEFRRQYEASHPKAWECLKKDQEVLFNFYDFPIEHWRSIRSTNVIESTFSTIRHRSRQTKGCGSRLATLTMVFKLGLEAEKQWYKLKGFQKMERVVSGALYQDGIEKIKTKIAA